MIQQMNAGLPAKRMLLSELLEMSEPHYVGGDGREYVLERKELETIRGILDKKGLRDVKLPIILIADASMEQSTWRVEGETECEVMMDVIGRNPPHPKERLFLYAAHLSVIRRRLPTTTVLMFLP